MLLSAKVVWFLLVLFFLYFHQYFKIGIEINNHPKALYKNDVSHVQESWIQTLSLTFFLVTSF